MHTISGARDETSERNLPAVALSSRNYSVETTSVAVSECTLSVTLLNSAASSRDNRATLRLNTIRRCPLVHDESVCLSVGKCEGFTKKPRNELETKQPVPSQPYKPEQPGNSRSPGLCMVTCSSSETLFFLLYLMDSIIKFWEE